MDLTASGLFRRARKVIPEVWAHLEDADSAIPESVRPFLAEACEEVRDIERRIALVERQLEALAEQTPAIQRLLTVPGIGLLTATAATHPKRRTREPASRDLLTTIWL